MKNKNTNQKSEKTKRGSELESLLHSEHTLEIEKLAVGGSGVGRIQFKDRKIVVFVPYSAPLDQIKIKITAVDKNFMTGQIIEIIKPGLGRRTADCKYYGVCGGCTWQHVDEKIQVEQKELILKDLFQKFLPDIKYTLKETIRAENNFEYRNRIQVKQIGTQVGFFKTESNDLVEINDCLIAEKPIRDWLKTASQKLRPSRELKKHEVKINHLNQVESYTIGTQSEGLSFSQVNRYINDFLVQKVLNIVETVQPTMITEFYAGSGNFTFPILEKFQKTNIDAIELNPNLTKVAVEKIKEKSFHKRAKFYTTYSETFAEQAELSSELILLDPPRSGCDTKLMQIIAQQPPQKLIYISCHPVSLVRDLQLLLKNNCKIEIQDLQIFDMFPQTDHFETVCVVSIYK